MRIDILVDSEAFLRVFFQDVFSAKERIYIQAMTFEADSAGMQVWNAIRNACAKEKRMLVDSYTKVMISDRFVYSPSNWRDPKFWSEVKATHALFREAEAQGIRMRYTNPLGFMLWNYPPRNHKKIIVIDNTVYVGGLNFSDHNFSWHDMMIRLHSEKPNPIAERLAEDFLFSWRGENRGNIWSEDSVEFFFLDGKNNARLFQHLFSYIEQARESIFIETPYLSFPFFKLFHRLAKTGISVNLLAPGKNNKPWMESYMFWEVQKSPIRLWLLSSQMTHLKAIRVDDRYLIVGSSNFDFVSYRCQQELIVVFRDPRVIRLFREKVEKPDLARAVLWEGKRVGVSHAVRAGVLYMIGVLLGLWSL